MVTPSWKHAVWLVSLLGCGETPIDPTTAATEGQVLFESYCATCHRYDGQDMGEAPPLDDSPWVAGSQETLIKIVLHGVRGRLEVNGQVYDREMPAIAAVLPDAEIAELLTYVRDRFGSIDVPVAADTVTGVRADTEDQVGYWQLEELSP